MIDDGERAVFGPAACILSGEGGQSGRERAPGLPGWALAFLTVLLESGQGVRAGVEVRAVGGPEKPTGSPPPSTKTRLQAQSQAAVCPRHTARASGSCSARTRRLSCRVQPATRARARRRAETLAAPPCSRCQRAQGSSRLASVPAARRGPSNASARAAPSCGRRPGRGLAARRSPRRRRPPVHAGPKHPRSALHRSPPAATICLKNRCRACFDGSTRRAIRPGKVTKLSSPAGGESSAP